MAAINRMDPSEREAFWARVSEDYARLRADHVAWQEFREEIALFEGGSLDGLEDEPPYFTPEEEAEIHAQQMDAAFPRAECNDPNQP